MRRITNIAFVLHLLTMVQDWLAEHYIDLVAANRAEEAGHPFWGRKDLTYLRRPVFLLPNTMYDKLIQLVLHQELPQPVPFSHALAAIT